MFFENYKLDGVSHSIRLTEYQKKVLRVISFYFGVSMSEYLRKLHKSISKNSVNRSMEMRDLIYLDFIGIILTDEKFREGK